jgi:hypothetical protein
MLTKLVLLNSCSYQLAELDFTEGDSMQLVGSNNVGKSSLIYSLNFLFLVNRNLMTFSGERSADKETLAHYFPEPERSFIVFEIRKRRKAYCIFVHRKGDGELRYLRFDEAYDRDLFFDSDSASAKKGKGAVMRDFKAVVGQLNRRAVKMTNFTQQQDILRSIYQIGRSNDAAVWLTKSSKTIGFSNSFSKVYRYLINSKLINNDALKEILLIADNRDQEKLSYSRQNIQQIDRLRMESQKMEVLRNIREEFDRFQELSRSVATRYEGLCRRSATLRISAKNTLADLLISRRKREEEQEEFRDKLMVKARERDQINRQLGGLQGDIRQTKAKLQELEQENQELLELPAESLLEQQLQNTDTQLEQVSYRLVELKGYDQKKQAELRKRTERLEARLQRLSRQQEQIDDWLISHLSSDPQTRRLLHAILSPEIARMSRSAVEKPVEKASRLIELFDGRIKLPDDFPLPEVTSPEELEAERKYIATDLDRLRKLVDTAERQDEVEQERAKLRADRDRIRHQLQRVKELPDLQDELKLNRRTLSRLEQEVEGLEEQLRLINEDASSMEKGITVLSEQLTENYQRYQGIERDLRALDQLQLPAWGEEEIEAIPSGLDLEEQLRTLQKDERALREDREQKNQLFVQLKSLTGFDLADEEAFIQTLEQELISMEDKERSIRALLDNIAVQFANPARKFLDSYLEFRQFIQQEFNRKLSEIQISNLESLQVELEPNERLQRDLSNIADLSLQSEGLFRLEESTTNRLGVLQTYLEKGVVVKFSELFSLRLRLKVNGKMRSVDLGKQVESDGTDRMLRLIIIMTVISRLSLRTPDNRVVLFIDEIATIDGKNRPQLVDFCREHHFYPIFAAPDFVDGFERYVMIRRNPSGQLIVEADKHYIDVDRTTQAETTLDA